MNQENDMDKNDSKSSLSGNSKGVIAPHDPFETSVLKLPLYVATSRINSDTIHVNASLNSYISTVRQRNEFLNMIVSRVRQLEGVFVPTVERRLRNGLIITVSGSWQYRQSPDLMHDDLFFLQPCQEFGSCHIISDDSDWDLDDDGAFDVGGQCVVSPEILQECLATGWGREHSLAGRYHPVLGSHIPATIMHFRAPKTEEEMEIIWTIIQHSYDWVHSQS